MEAICLKKEGIVKDETKIYSRRSWYDRLSSEQRKSGINYFRCLLGKASKKKIKFLMN